MRHDPITSSKRKPVNLSLDTGVVAAARKAGVNMSRVTEAALRVAITSENERRWREEHRVWIQAHNDWIDQNGIPLGDLPVL